MVTDTFDALEAVVLERLTRAAHARLDRPRVDDDHGGLRMGLMSVCALLSSPF